MPLIVQSDYDHRTALHLACCEGHSDVAGYLIGMVVNDVKTGRLEAKEAMAALQYRDFNDADALMIAKKHGHKDIEHLITIAGATIVRSIMEQLLATHEPEQRELLLHHAGRQSKRLSPPRLKSFDASPKIPSDHVRRDTSPRLPDFGDAVRETSPRLPDFGDAARETSPWVPDFAEVEESPEIPDFGSNKTSPGESPKALDVGGSTPEETDSDKAFELPTLPAEIPTLDPEPEEELPKFPSERPKLDHEPKLPRFPSGLPIAKLDPEPDSELPKFPSELPKLNAEPKLPRFIPKLSL